MRECLRQRGSDRSGWTGVVGSPHHPSETHTHTQGVWGTGVGEDEYSMWDEGLSWAWR